MDKNKNRKQKKFKMKLRMKHISNVYHTKKYTLDVGRALEL